ncbi:MAG: hypothetical protein V1886_00625 [archaeon]
MRMKIMKNNSNQKILKTQIVLNIAAIIMFVVILNFSILLSPSQGMQTRGSSVSFSWLGFASSALVDDNPDFTSPIIAEKNRQIELKPGTYYWCVQFMGKCLDKQEFAINSDVVIDVKTAVIDNETAYRIENKGNTRVMLNIIGMLTGKAILEPDAVIYEKNSSDITKIIASENE